MIERLLKAVYPEKCPFCREVIKSGDSVCSCSLPFVELGTQVRALTVYNDCFEEVISVFYYEPVVQQAILQYKYYAEGSNYIPAGRVFASYMKRALLQRGHPEYDCIAFVPMAKSDLKKRKFNQAQHLAKTLGKGLKIPCEELLVKTKQNQTQHDLHANMRRANVAGVFALHPKSEVKGKKILLVDDILTTGATVNECSRALRANGAKRVDILTLAVTKPKR